MGRSSSALWGAWAFCFCLTAIAAEPATRPAPEQSRPLPSLRDVLLLPPDQACQTVLTIWAEGNQIAAETYLGWLVGRHPQHQRLAFFRAACMRSRFDVQSALPMFQEVARADPGSPEGRCTAAILALDSGRDLEANFKTLLELVKANAQDPLIVWMLAVQCRARNRNEEGVAAYRELLKLVPVGSSLVHQTFANVLDETKQYEEALKHREIVVRQEPRGGAFMAWATRSCS